MEEKKRFVILTWREELDELKAEYALLVKEWSATRSYSKRILIDERIFNLTERINLLNAKLNPDSWYYNGD